MSFVNLKYKPKKTDVICQYRIIPKRKENFRKAAEAIAGESSIGTWTELRTMNEKIAKKLSPKVYYMNKKNNRIKIAYPLELFELGNVPEIMSSIGGNIFGMKMLKGLFWEDINIPKKMLKSFKGPKYGIKGLRKKFRVKNRPFVGTIVKPKVGLNPKQHAQVAYESWIGGCDIVKDDENLTSQNFNEFKKRFLLTTRKRIQAEKETGEKKAYLANCTAETEEMLRRIKFVEDNGGNYVMLDILTLGWAGLQTARNHTKLPIHAHRAGHAMLDRVEKRKGFGMSMEVIAQFARMIGVDTLHIGAAYGKMSGGKDEILHIEEEMEEKSTEKTRKNLSQKWFDVKPVLAVASGGVYPGIVDKIVGLMGKDVVIQAGGGIHGHPDGSRKGALAMRQAVDAAIRGISLKKYAENHEELEKALKKWGQ